MPGVRDRWFEDENRLFAHEFPWGPKTKAAAKAAALGLTV